MSAAKTAAAAEAAGAAAADPLSKERHQQVAQPLLSAAVITAGFYNP
jgi:hypothetical protein